ncbi:helix-turn-helix transcriptional regulator [Pontibacter qinzhouensis]|uniref:Helix-turn-helix transcriptional regulator n=1 Tax=Pontibacter qinzhouensis TaxID=2603253 RepID=A0A5C8K9W2_9BACT|nr:AraC family transcriptional regulator [Pontibacter qinzhouensis]TXK47151.1 helix-turn-helix transcriptional regulator [Pontibacter qinzhouensis]
MTHKGENITFKGEFSEACALTPEEQQDIWHLDKLFSIKGDECLKRSFRLSEGGRLYEYASRGIYFRHTAGCFSSPTRLVLAQDAPCVYMAFSVQNKRSYTVPGATKPLAKQKAHQHNLYLLPQQHLQVEWQPEAETEFFDIFISPESFFRYLPASHPLYASFQHAMATNKHAQLSSSNLPLTPRLISLLFEILNCQFSGHCKCLFAEAKVVELLALQLDQHGQQPTQAEHKSLKADDVEKMQQVKDIILTNLHSSITLKDLAHQVGTNEYNLKKHFKEVFGSTVFGYLHNYKMEQSRELLLLRETKIAEIARQMGYKHATHFTTAFKKHFGFPPNKLKM